VQLALYSVEVPAVTLGIDQTHQRFTAPMIMRMQLLTAEGFCPSGGGPLLLRSS
jgi:hypothetical protein